MVQQIENQTNIENNEQLQKQQLLQWVQNLANNEKDPQKKVLIPQLWEKIINEFQAETGYPLTKMQEKINSTWRTVLEELLSQLPAKRMQAFLPIFEKWNKKRGWLFNFLKSELNKFSAIANRDKTTVDRILQNEKIIETIKSSQQILADKNPEIYKNFSWFNENELKQELIDLNVWVDFENDIIPYCEKYTQDTGKELTPSQVVSFIYTHYQLEKKPDIAEELKQNPDSNIRQAYEDFTTNFDTFAQSMDIEFPPKQISWPLAPAVPAQDLQNLTTDQSAQIIDNTDGMQDYQNFGKVETVENYDDPDLKLETDDQLETDIYQKAFADLDDQTTDSLAAISKNISPENIQREKTQKKAFLDKFNGDATKLQAEINKLKKGEKTVFTAEDIANLQKLSKLSKLEHRDDNSTKTIEHGKIKIAKLASNTARMLLFIKSIPLIFIKSIPVFRASFM